ncbi:MAG: hypothetical protein LKM39_08200 [Chiayiivirga sp.]|nr:hypothetical protein [Chiayiivirga sp.]
MPIALFVAPPNRCAASAQRGVVAQIAQRVEKDGIDAWYDHRCARAAGCRGGSLRESHRHARCLV